MPKQTQAKVSSELDKAAEAVAQSWATVRSIRDEKAAAEARLEQIRGDLQTAEHEMQRAETNLVKVAAGIS